MTLDQFKLLKEGDKVRIAVLPFLPYTIGRVAFRVNEQRAWVRYFDANGSPCSCLFHAEDLGRM